MIRVLNSSRPVPTEEAVFFPLDRFNVPFSGGLRVDLATGEKKGTVVSGGEKGAVDEWIRGLRLSSSEERSEKSGMMEKERGNLRR